ncbi:MAG: cation diffusion facilitator family transporter [Nitrososphaeraceae archaeon]
MVEEDKYHEGHEDNVGTVDAPVKDGDMFGIKFKVALTSILVSVGLTVLKFLVGVSTNSLGILTEAMHSGLDVIAAIVTLYAIHMVARPPDTKYTYGYAKFESISSFVQIALLFATASWVFYEALDRIFFRTVKPEITIFSFGIMFISVCVDFLRYRTLNKTARTFGSQALEADAIHFKADMFSSGIVIIGLILASIFPIANIDAYVALILGALIIYTSLGLGRRTLDILLDKAPKGAYQRVLETVSGLEGVDSAHDIRVRRIGTKDFVDMHIEVPRTLTHATAHKVATKVENKIRDAFPNSDVLVHVDAIESGNETISDRIRLIAAETDGIANIHSIYVSRILNPDLGQQYRLMHDKFPNWNSSSNNKDTILLHLYLDVQMTNTLDLKTAHRIVDEFERRIKAEIPEILNITTHIESEITKNITMGIEKKVNAAYLENIRRAAYSVSGVINCEDIGVIDINGDIHITLTIRIESLPDGSITTIEDAHRIATAVQNLIVKETGASRVIVHTEPS